MSLSASPNAPEPDAEVRVDVGVKCGGGMDFGAFFWLAGVRETTTGGEFGACIGTAASGTGVGCC